MKNANFYTDGACSHNGSWNGGWGVVLVIDGSDDYLEMGGSEKNTTNNRMELTAFLEAMKHSVELSDSHIIKIYTDSAYISNAFKDDWISGWIKRGWKNAKKQPVANRDLWEEILKVKSQIKNLEIVKVKGHSDNKYNNIADEIAVRERNKL